MSSNNDVFRGTIWIWIVAPLIAAVIAVFENKVVVVITEAIDIPMNFFTPMNWPEFYTVYLVMDSRDRNQYRLTTAFMDSKTNLQIDGISINVKVSDLEKADADKLANKDDVLMVVLSYRPAAAALSNYLNADPPIPVIQAGSIPRLLPKRAALAPVFSLSPDLREEQAEKAADFVIGHGAKNIWVVNDAETGTVDPDDLAQTFVRQIQKKNQNIQVHKKHQNYENRQAYESKATNVLLRTTILQPPSADLVKALRIDGVFVAGSSPLNCLMLTLQVKEIWRDSPNIPKILLSSSCAGPEMLQPGTEGAILTHPRLASEQEDDRMTSCKSSWACGLRLR